MDPKLRQTITAWLKQYEALPPKERTGFFETCHRRDPVAAQLMQELLAATPKSNPEK